MREVIKNQLKKLRNVSYTCDEATRTIHFFKKGSSENSFEEEKIYDIEVDEDTLHNIKSVLYTNYNNCSLPPSKYLTIEVNKIVGNYIKVTAVDTITDKMWRGYLPIDKTRVLKEVK